MLLPDNQAFRCKLSDIVYRYSYVPVPTILEFSNSNAFIRGLMGPFGSGKSSGCAVEVVQRSIDQFRMKDNVRRSRWAIIRNTFPQLSDTTIRTFMGSDDGSSDGWFPQRYFGNYNKTDHDYMMDFDDGNGRVINEVLFRALDRPDHVKNILSMELTGAWVNEAREVPKAIIEALQGRVGRFPAMRDGGSKWSGVIMDTNPPDTDHWWFKLFEEMKPENAQLFRQPSGRSQHAENLANLPQNYYSNLMIGKTSDFVKVYVDGEYGYVQDGKPIYPQYIDSLHVSKVPLMPTPHIPLILGWDFGLTPACVIIQQSKQGQVRVLKELLATDMGIRRFAREVVRPILNTEFRGYEIVSVADEAGRQRAQTDERTCFDELREAGIKTVPARTNSIIARIAAVEAFLTKRLGIDQPAFIIDPSCSVLRKGFNGAYRFRRMQVVGDERFADEPEKNEYSHIHDALQYACMEADRTARIVQRQVLAPYVVTAPPPSALAWT